MQGPAASVCPAGIPAPWSAARAIPWRSAVHFPGAFPFLRCDSLPRQTVERLRRFLPDLVAASPRAGARDGDDPPHGGVPESRRKDADGFLDDPGGEPPPPRVDGRGDGDLPVGEKDRDAIRRVDPHPGPGDSPSRGRLPPASTRRGHPRLPVRRKGRTPSGPASASRPFPRQGRRPPAAVRDAPVPPPDPRRGRRGRPPARNAAGETARSAEGVSSGGGHSSPSVGDTSGSREMSPCQECHLNVPP